MKSLPTFGACNNNQASEEHVFDGSHELLLIKVTNCKTRAFGSGTSFVYIEAVVMHEMQSFQNVQQEYAVKVNCVNCLKCQQWYDVSIQFLASALKRRFCVAQEYLNVTV